MTISGEYFEGSVKRKVDMVVCLFMTRGVSLFMWDKIGIIDREIKIYERLSRNNIRYVFFTYGDSRDVEIAQRYPWAQVVPLFLKRRSRRGLWWMNILSLVTAPWRYGAIFRQCNLFKTNQITGAWLAVLMARLFGKKVLVRAGYEALQNSLYCRSHPIRKVMLFVSSFLSYTFSDAVILTSQESRIFVRNTFGVNPAKIHVISNYVDTDLFMPHESTHRKTDRVVFVGRLSGEKNISNLIAACGMLGLGLDIIGKGSLLELLRNEASAIGADVIFYGTVSNEELPCILNQYDLFVLPSLYEGNPKALLEAMSCGLAVVGTDVQGIRENIVHGFSGILCMTDVTSIADAIGELLSDRKLMERIKYNARRYIERTCSLVGVVERELKCYKSILGTSNG